MYCTFTEYLKHTMSNMFSEYSYSAQVRHIRATARPNTGERSENTLAQNQIRREERATVCDGKLNITAANLRYPKRRVKTSSWY